MIISVVGPIGAGKDVLSDILVSEHGFEKISLGNLLRKELEEKGIELTRRNLQDFGDKWRKESGAEYLARKAVDSVDASKRYVFTSFRNPSELAFLKSVFPEMAVLMIDAPFGKRFDNLNKRGREQDPKSIDEFRSVEDRDFGVEQEEHAQQNAACFEMANRVIVNSGTIDDLRKKVRGLLGELEE